MSLIGSEKCSLNLTKNKIKTVFSNSENTLFCQFEFVVEYDDEDVQLNIININKLIQVLTIIDEDVITIEHDKDDNKLKYKSKTSKFNMHLLDSSIMLVKNFNFQRIIDLNYVSKFTIDLSSFKSLQKAISFADVSKVYLTNNGSDVECELTDRSKANTDSFSTTISDNFAGQDVDGFCFEVDVIKKLQSLIKDKINVSISTNKVIFFEYEQKGEYTLKFATSALKG